MKNKAIALQPLTEERCLSTTFIEHIESVANADSDASSRLPIDDDTEKIQTDFSHVKFF